MLRQFQGLLWAALAVGALACSEAATPAETGDTEQADAQVATDTALGETTGDAVQPADVQPDILPTDTADAVALDAAVSDTTEGDTAADVSGGDAPQDDAALPDAAEIDAQVADIASDAAPDAVQDTGLDAVLDAAPDAAPDAKPDTAPDAAADAAVSEVWYPSWKDKNGCENYEHFENGVCVAENPKQEKLETVLCWKNGQVNDLGVGKPCMPGSGMCAGLVANCCVMDAKKYGAMCSIPCDASTGCGPGAYCHQTFGGGICMPAACTDLFEGYYSVYKKKDKGFKCAASANSKGVGTTCKAGGAACLAFANSYCLGDGPFYLPADQPQLTSFCTIPCELSADCGAGAECIYSNGKPYFCSPTQCSAQFVDLLFGNKPGETAPTSTAEVCVPE